MLIADGGDSAHYPTHCLDGCLSAWVAGANWIKLEVQISRDGVPVLFPTDVLDELTDRQGLISEHTFRELRGIDTGYAFNPGTDFPWKRVREPYERNTNHPRLRSTLSSLSYLLQRIPESCGLMLVVDLSIDELFKRALQEVRSEIRKSDIERIVILIRDKSRLPIVIDEIDTDNRIKVGYELAEGELLSELDDGGILDGLSVLVCSKGQSDRKLPSILIAVHDALVQEMVPSSSSMAYITDSALEAMDVLGGRRICYEEKFEGQSLNSDDWVEGISGGFETPTRYLRNPNDMRFLAEDHREIFDTKIIIDDSLVFDIDEGYQYASAGVVSRFPIRNDFWIEVDWEYANPNRATMMLLGLINTDVFASHRADVNKNGQIIRPSWNDEHQIFDTHGNPPFVSMEHEENDGTRIICNRVDSGFYRWYNNFYQPNVGNGNATEGRFRIMRRGQFFAAYYTDPANEQWVGVGALENTSMNDSLYVRMGAKHYPKRGSTDPLPANRCTFRNFKVFKRENS